jgi:hypothetical protein
VVKARRAAIKIRRHARTVMMVSRQVKHLNWADKSIKSERLKTRGRQGGEGIWKT